jgi:hypothetical protein
MSDSRVLAVGDELGQGGGDDGRRELLGVAEAAALDEPAAAGGRTDRAR